VRARRLRRRGALEAERAVPVDVAAEAAVHSRLGGDRSGDRLTSLGCRRGRQGEGDREAADGQAWRRRAVVGGREARVHRGVGRRAGVPVVETAVADVRAGAGAPCPARAVRIGVARPGRVRARVAGLVADRARLDARRIREEVSPEEELRAERQAQARGAGGAVRRAGAILGHGVDDAQADRRGGRVRNRERRAEQAPDGRAVPLAARLGRSELAEGEARAVADARHRGERAAHVGDFERQRYAGAPAAGVEAAALEVLQQDAGAGRQRPAVAGPYAGGEVQPARTGGEAAAARKRGGRGRGGGGRRGDAVGVVRRQRGGRRDGGGGGGGRRGVGLGGRGGGGRRRSGGRGGRGGGRGRRLSRSRGRRRGGRRRPGRGRGRRRGGRR